MTTAASRPAKKATIAVAVTACPASDSEMSSDRAIGVSRLAGRNSAVTKLATPSVRERTAGHEARSTAGGVHVRSAY